MGSKNATAVVVNVADAAVEEFARHVIRVALRKVFRLLAQATQRKSGDAELTHQLRTATRRADAALRLLVDWLPRRRQVWMRKRLGVIREKAGAVRDLDVLIRRLPRFADQLPLETLSWLQEHAASCRTTAVRSLRRYGRSQPMETLQDHSRALRHRVRWRGDAKEPTLDELGSPALGRLVENYSAALQAIHGDVEQCQQVLRCHKVRIVGRRLRYTLELLQDTLPTTLTEPVCERLSEFQDTLGEINDQTTTLGHFREWLADCDDEGCRTSLRKLIDREAGNATERVTAIVAEVPRQAEQMLNLLRELPTKPSGSER